MMMVPRVALPRKTYDSVPVRAPSVPWKNPEPHCATRPLGNVCVPYCSVAGPISVPAYFTCATALTIVVFPSGNVDCTVFETTAIVPATGMLVDADDAAGP